MNNMIDLLFISLKYFNCFKKVYKNYTDLDMDDKYKCKMDELSKPEMVKLYDHFMKLVFKMVMFWLKF